MQIYRDTNNTNNADNADIPIIVWSKYIANNW